MSTATLHAAAGISLSERLPSKWIISGRQDLIWFIGSALISYFALGLMALGVGVALIQFIWFFGVDGPHVQSTITRTYFDKAERARLGRYPWTKSGDRHGGDDMETAIAGAQLAGMRAALVKTGKFREFGPRRIRQAGRGAGFGGGIAGPVGTAVKFRRRPHRY